MTDPRLSGLLRCLSQRAGEGSTAAGSPGAPGGGWWARWPLSPEGRERQGWFFGASEHHQFWPPPLGTPNLSWQRPARQRALPLLFLLWTASAPQEWPSFLIILLGGKKTSVKSQHLPRAPAALPTASRLCQMGTETCSWVRAGSTESKSLRSGTRKRGTEQEWMGAVPAGHGAGCFCLCTATSQSSWHLLGPGDICHPPWGLTCKCPSPQKAKTPSQAATRCARPA